MGNWGELRMKERRIENDILRKPVSPPMGLGAPCCDGGLSGLCLVIIHFKFLIFNHLQI